MSEQEEANWTPWIIDQLRAKLAEAQKKLAWAGVEGSPAPGQQGVIPELRAKLAAAEQRAEITVQHITELAARCNVPFECDFQPQETLKRIGDFFEAAEQRALEAEKQADEWRNRVAPEMKMLRDQVALALAHQDEMRGTFESIQSYLNKKAASLQAEIARLRKGEKEWERCPSHNRINCITCWPEC